MLQQQLPNLKFNLADKERRPTLLAIVVTFNLFALQKRLLRLAKQKEAIVIVFERSVRWTPK